jgi:hypothetical protein
MSAMNWKVVNHPEFDDEFDALSHPVRNELLAALIRLRAFGPSLGRPHIDTLGGSRHANMKELRFASDGGVWRVAFAFDPIRQAIVLVAGNKSNAPQTRFYKQLIAKADRRFDQHLADLRDLEG